MNSGKLIVTIQNDPMTIVLSYAGPQDPPGTGSEWPEEQDYPGVQCQVVLPAGNLGSLRADLQSKKNCAGEPLNYNWGYTPAGSPGVRVRRTVFREPTLEASEAAARAWGAEAQAVIQSVVSARATRLAKREATIAAAHARHGEVTPED
jgi:hypothetical protein